MSKDLSLVVPVYNSRESLETLHTRIHTSLKKLSLDYEVILIDDGSYDNSYDKMVELFMNDSHISILQLTRNFGQQNALMCGLHYANGKIIVTLDDDLQHPPEEIEKMLYKLNEGYDVVFGVPFNKKHSLYRNIGTKLISYLFNLVCRKPRGIEVSSFRVMRREIVKDIIKDRHNFVYLAPIIFRLTKKVATVKVRHDARKYGNSNYTIFKLVFLLIKLIIHYAFDFKVIEQPQFEIKDIRLRGDRL